MPDPAQLTERQSKWFASVREGLERDTGRSIEQWALLARACPESAHRKRLAWMKATYGLGQNHASLVLRAAFPPEVSWSQPDALDSALWADPSSRAIFEAVRAAAADLPGTVQTQRRGFTAFSRAVQYAAVRPVKSAVELGLALEPSADAGLAPERKQAWSERLKSTVPLTAPAEVDARIKGLLRAAWERS